MARRARRRRRRARGSRESGGLTTRVARCPASGQCRRGRVARGRLSGRRPRAALPAPERSRLAPCADAMVGSQVTRRRRRDGPSAPRGRGRAEPTRVRAAGPPARDRRAAAGGARASSAAGPVVRAARSSSMRRPSRIAAVIRRGVPEQRAVQRVDVADRRRRARSRRAPPPGAPASRCLVDGAGCRRARAARAADRSPRGSGRGRQRAGAVAEARRGWPAPRSGSTGSARR